MSRLRIIFTVTTDLTYDQRMQRICRSLSREYEVTLVGRQLPDSLPLKNEPYQQHRLVCQHHTGKLFYTEYNWKLYWWLARQSFDAVCAVDLDTILPAHLVTKRRRKLLIYDSHEYFTEMEEIVRRPAIQKAWQALEEWLVPKVDLAYTVSQNIADIYQQKYQIPFHTIRNIAALSSTSETQSIQSKDYFIYVGAVNEGRGLEQIIRAFQNIDSQLLICGKGDKLQELQQLTIDLNLSDKIIFKGYIQPEFLRELIAGAIAGFLLLTNKGKSYYYSLANKFFDYMQAGIPQITIDFPEYRLINNQHKFALLIDLDEAAITKAANDILHHEEIADRLSQHARDASKVLNWQNEEKKLLDLYRQLFSESSGEI